MEKYNVGYISAESITPTESPATISMEVYERMCRALYAYRFGTIEFLDLLATFEKALDIKSPQTNVEDAPDERNNRPELSTW